MSGCIVRAPAKINFRLRVTGRRADGYHLLEGIVLPVSVFDSLRIRLTDDPVRRVRLSSTRGDLPANEHNLAGKAAALFLQETGLSLGVEVSLEKNIPVGAGLGGGSSDAAATLRALNVLTGANLPIDDLMRLGLQLGADVPFFLACRPARVSGVGEVVTPLGSYPKPNLVVAFPGVPLLTRAVYEEFDTALTKHGVPSNRQNFSDSQADSFRVAANDLESAATRLLPSLRGLKDMLTDLGATQVAMTGSGSAIFGTWSDIAEARAAAAELQVRGVWARQARVLDGAPPITVD